MERKRRKNLTSIEKEEIIELINEDFSDEEIAETYDCSTSTIKNIRLNYTDKKMFSKTQLTDEVKNKVIELVNEGYKYQEICDLVGISTNSIYKIKNLVDLVNPYNVKSNRFEILKLLNDGYSPKEISEKLGVNETRIYMVIYFYTKDGFTYKHDECTNKTEEKKMEVNFEMCTMFDRTIKLTQERITVERYLKVAGAPRYRYRKYDKHGEVVVELVLDRQSAEELIYTLKYLPGKMHHVEKILYCYNVWIPYDDINIRFRDTEPLEVHFGLFPEEDDVIYFWYAIEELVPGSIDVTAYKTYYPDAIDLPVRYEPIEDDPAV